MSIRHLSKLFLFLSTLLLTTSVVAQTGWTAPTLEAYNAGLPDDIDHESRGRLPIVDRELLDDKGKATFDRYGSPDSTSLAGIQGPGGIRLHASIDTSPTLIDNRMRELIRLAIAREMDHQFEWTMHEPVALKEGISAEVIDIIRHRRSLEGVAAADAAVIGMIREMMREHRISSATYAALADHYGPRDMIEITELMASGMNSFFLLNLFDVRLPHDREPRLTP